MAKAETKKEYLKDKDGNFLYNKKGKIKTRKVDLVGWDKSELIEEWRQEWANHANKMLEREGVNERIDHRSHEERGLEFQPTQHVGYKANAMEKEGIQTERGNYNREVKAYNQTVVDLQAYREEKRQLEQEKAQEEQFSTAAERTQLASAEKFLKAKPTFEAIDKRLRQLIGFENKVERDYQALEQKDQDFKEIKKHLFEISSSQNRIKENQEKLDSVGRLEGLTKRGKTIKKSAESEIQRHKALVQEHERKLEPYREKYGFRSKPEFKAIDEKYQSKRTKLREQNRNQRGAIRRERDVLQKAKTALENRFIREVASKYPNTPEMAYLDYKTPKQIDTINQSNKAQKVHSISDFKEMRN
ncbi:MobA/MobL family protein [Salinibacillus kushneri]|uniref:MobA/MobL family protein n=1 Tax=Salinibacillus kushneri TaxID=237682 RepID=A0A1I0ESL9_9BACI|nr:MobA/MobL family protein [Salinibacillus kushneri]SET48490.1 MobA/MobL family protein [Salinibacillus kushneri]